MIASDYRPAVREGLGLREIRRVVRSVCPGDRTWGTAPRRTLDPAGALAAEGHFDVAVAGPTGGDDVRP
ncbi:hypothetical protein A6E15_01625 [Natrinema saccharevitans]|uniref:Uncharacterized protein n=1 Tax=Natrinema saccharevitans TaxID=301967 RepID=A0A1S8ASV4_9EURY|nr:hypothetical protein [Natrinema saccharevitans]OLZ39762.1 hypothetical protein A6E15_01625 [Natrinema saccharevitans]